jgi:hypothetical protein
VTSMRLLFFMRAIHYGRMAENVLRTLLDRGHEVHVALAVGKRRHGAGGDWLFADLADTYARFSYRELEPRSGPWERPATAMRYALDYLRYFSPEYAGAGPLRERAHDLAPGLVRALLRTTFLIDIRVKLIDALLRPIEAAVPIPEEVGALLRAYSPDVVMVTPLIRLGSFEVDYIRAAAAAGVPSVFPVSSWDNLTNKGVLRAVPDVTIVWNQTQLDDAVRLQKLPHEKVVVVGAHSFDHWFQWEPEAGREELLSECGLDPERPYVLYLGSSRFVADEEAVFVQEWISRMRAHPRLRDAGVMVRPHPYNTSGWDAIRDEPGIVTVWPRAGEVPETPAAKRAYFDALYHSGAVVGVNTSAFIEAAILGKQAFALHNGYFRTQDGTLHFAQIADDGRGDGAVAISGTWREHLDQIADAVECPDRYHERSNRFVVRFVRPYGTADVAAARAADAIERAAELKVDPVPVPFWARILVRGLTPMMAALAPMRNPRSIARRVTKSRRRLAKRARRKLKHHKRAAKQRMRHSKRRLREKTIARR